MRVGERLHGLVEGGDGGLQGLDDEGLEHLGVVLHAQQLEALRVLLGHLARQPLPHLLLEQHRVVVGPRPGPGPRTQARPRRRGTGAGWRGGRDVEGGRVLAELLDQGLGGSAGAQHGPGALVALGVHVVLAVLDLAVQALQLRQHDALELDGGLGVRSSQAARVGPDVGEQARYSAAAAAAATGIRGGRDKMVALTQRALDGPEHLLELLGDHAVQGLRLAHVGLQVGHRVLPRAQALYQQCALDAVLAPPPSRPPVQQLQ